MRGANLGDRISDSDDDEVAPADNRGRTLTARVRVMLAVGEVARG